MIRYFGFLANRVVSEKLPQVKKALGQKTEKQQRKPSFRELSQNLLNINPFTCLLCGGVMRYRRAYAAIRLTELITNAAAIARMRYVV